MPSKYPAPTPKEVISALKAMGFWQVSQKGSHVKFTDGIRTAIVPMHGALSKWTFKAIVDQSGRSLEEFQRYL